MNRDKPSLGEPARARRENLGEMLVKENLITREQLENALNLQREHGGKLSSILISRGLLKAEELATVLSVQLNMPLVLFTHSCYLKGGIFGVMRGVFGVILGVLDDTLGGLGEIGILAVTE